MKATGWHRISSAALMATFFGWYIRHDCLKWHDRGRDAFVANQMERFHKFIEAPKPLAFHIATTLITAILVFGLYELIAAVFSRLFPVELAGQQANVTKAAPGL